MEHTTRLAARLLLIPLTLFGLPTFAFSSHASAVAGANPRSPAPAACDGSWAVFPNPAPSGSLLLGVAAISATDAWAVGNQGVGNHYAPLAEHWDGAAWNLVDVPHSRLDSYFTAVSGSASDDVWAVGYTFSTFSRTLVEHWDGVEWTILPTPNPSPSANRLWGVTAIARDDAWAAGTTTSTQNDAEVAMILHWDGSRWRVSDGASLGGGTSELSGVSGTGPDDVWVAGRRTNGHDGLTQSLTEHWDGSTWQAVQALHHQNKPNVLTGVAAISPSSALATGYRHDGLRPLGLRWDGTAWSIANADRVDDTINNLYGVSADAAGDAWTVGYYYIPGDSQAQTLIEQWDGSAWHMVASPNDGTVSYLYGAATVSSAQAWAVGQNASNTALVEEYC